MCNIVLDLCTRRGVSGVSGFGAARDQGGHHRNLGTYAQELTTTTKLPVLQQGKA